MATATETKGLELSFAEGRGFLLEIGMPERTDNGEGIYIVHADTVAAMPWMGALLRALGFRFLNASPRSGEQTWALPARAVVIDRVHFHVAAAE